MYFGIAVLYFAALSLKFFKKNKIVRFFVLASILAFLSFIPQISSFEKILPVLSTGIPSRAILIIAISFAVLSAVGVDEILRKKMSKSYFLKTAFIFGLIYICLWAFAIFNFKIGDPKTIADFKISLRNLIIPSISFLLISFAVCLFNIQIITKKNLLYSNTINYFA